MSGVPRAWFSLAIKTKNVPTDVMREAGWSRAQICSLRKLAKVPQRIGELCDELRVPWAIARFIAHAKAEDIQERATQAIAKLIEKREKRSGTPDKLARALARVLKEDRLPGLAKVGTQRAA